MIQNNLEKAQIIMFQRSDVNYTNSEYNLSGDQVLLLKTKNSSQNL